MKSGIYCIKSKIDNKMYIGSSVNIKARMSSHKSHLKYNKHGNIYLQNTFNKYGIENFEFLILEFCEENKLGIREKYYCDIYQCNCNKTGYNLAIVSEDRLLRLSSDIYLKSVETRRKNNNYKVSDKTKRKISDSNKGKESNFKGKFHSLETRLKFSENKKGTNLNTITKNKISKKLKGRVFSEEHKSKIAEKLRIKMKEIKKCEYCGTEMNTFNYRKYHDNNCKFFKGKIHI